MQLQHDESEAADVWRPPAQMPHQVLFQFIGKNFLSQIRKRAAAPCSAVTLRVTGGRNVWTIVIQKRTHVQQIVNIKADCFQIACQQRRAVDVAVDDVVLRDFRFAHRQLGHPPGHFVEVRAHYDERLLFEDSGRGLSGI